MKKVAVFLRAVNLAGRSLKMTDFKTALAAAGCREAQTLGAAGNAVVLARAADATLEAAIEAGLSATFHHSTEVFVRDGPALAAILARNPFPRMALQDPSHLVVIFLHADPSPEALSALGDQIAGREEVAPGPQCLYATYPDGIGRSKLTAGVIEKALKLRGTARNWNTVGKMAELAAT